MIDFENLNMMRPRKPSQAHEYALLGGEVGV